MQLVVSKWIRFAIGFVFIVSGMIKLLNPDFVQFFTHLGFPFPVTFLFLLAITEITCGSLIVVNMYIKYTSLLLIIIMIGALIIVKLPVLFDGGIISFLFDSRLDIVMLILLVLLLKNDKKGKGQALD